jgi:hypothetical protein
MAQNRKPSADGKYRGFFGNLLNTQKPPRPPAGVVSSAFFKKGVKMVIDSTGKEFPIDPFKAKLGEANW